MSTSYPSSPNAFLVSLITHRVLLWELAKRDFIGRYKGSFIGVIWTLLHPLLMLVIYTLVFSVAFKARWSEVGSDRISFTLVLFSGLIVHGFFADCLNRSSGVIVNQPNYVKKVVFPLEILPCVVLCTALFHFLVSLSLLLAFCFALNVTLKISILLIPVIMFPLILMALGLTLIFASLGVYLRDIAQVMGVFTSVLLFLSPVFYRISAFPKEYRYLFSFNPLTLPIEQLRDLLLWGNAINWTDWCTSLLIGSLMCYFGFWWFQKSRKGFADVL
jgi:lipopolysaccharide transport system permease protein